MLCINQEKGESWYNTWGQEYKSSREQRGDQLELCFYRTFTLSDQQMDLTL